MQRLMECILLRASYKYLMSVPDANNASFYPQMNISSIDELDLSLDLSRKLGVEVGWVGYSEDAVVLGVF